MQKLVLLSVILATFVIPARLSRGPGGHEAFRRTARGFLGFVALYVLLLLYVYPRLS